MLKDYIFWGLFIAVVAGVIASLLKRRRRGPDPRGPAHSNRMQFHAHTDADAHDSGAPRLVCIGGSHDGHTLAIPPGGLSIGRARDNLLIIVDGRISSHHAWIGMAARWSTRINSPVCISQRRIASSKPPLARNRPSSEKASAVTARLWPRNR